MAGNIVMSYLLLGDANRNDAFKTTLNVYCNMAEAEVTKHAEFIKGFKPENLEYYTVR
jgi:hypothetical protein